MYAYCNRIEEKIRQIEEARSKAHAARKKPELDISSDDLFLWETDEHKWAFAAHRLTDEAVEQLEHAVDLHQAGDEKGAELIYRRLIRHYPEFIDAHHHLALVLDETGREEAAFRRWKLAVEIGFRSFPPTFMIGRDTLPWAWLENRPFLEACRSLGIRYLVRGRHYDASSVFENILNLNPDDNQGVRAILVDSYLAVDAVIPALEVCDRFPGDSMTELLYGRVLALYRLGRFDEAQDALEIAVRHKPLVAEELIKDAHVPPEDFDPDLLIAGDPGEACHYWIFSGPLWLDSPDAIDFVEDFLLDTGALDAGSRPTTRSQQTRRNDAGGETVH